MLTFLSFFGGGYMIQVKIYDSMQRQKVLLEPLGPIVTMYVCGMTVYDLCHIGHARVIIFFDVVRRYLESINYPVKYVRNITDVDDKIIAKSSAENKSVNEITSETIKWFIEDNNYLNVNKPTHEPKATHYISQMIAMIEVLILKKIEFSLT